MKLVRVVAPHFVAGLDLKDDIVVAAAPILKWAVGWDRARLSAYFKRKRWQASIIKEFES